jgi:hypothetical protein
LTKQHRPQGLAQLFAVCREQGAIWRPRDGRRALGRMRNSRRTLLGLPGWRLSSAVDAAPFLVLDVSAPCLPPEPLALEAAQIDGGDAHALAAHFPGIALRFEWSGADGDGVTSDRQVSFAKRRRNRGRVRTKAAVEGLGQHPRTPLTIRILFSQRLVDISHSSLLLLLLFRCGG